MKDATVVEVIEGMKEAAAELVELVSTEITGLRKCLDLERYACDEAQRERAFWKQRCEEAQNERNAARDEIARLTGCLQKDNDWRFTQFIRRSQVGQIAELRTTNEELKARVEAEQKACAFWKQRCEELQGGTLDARVISWKWKQLCEKAQNERDAARDEVVQLRSENSRLETLRVDDSTVLSKKLASALDRIAVLEEDLQQWKAVAKLWKNKVQGSGE